MQLESIKIVWNIPAERRDTRTTKNARRQVDKPERSSIRECRVRRTYEQQIRLSQVHYEPENRLAALVDLFDYAKTANGWTASSLRESQHVCVPQPGREPVLSGTRAEERIFVRPTGAISRLVYILLQHQTLPILEKLANSWRNTSCTNWIYLRQTDSLQTRQVPHAKNVASPHTADELVVAAVPSKEKFMRDGLRVVSEGSLGGQSRKTLMKLPPKR